MALTTWRAELDSVRAANNDSAPLVIYPPDLDLDLEFDDSHGDAKGEPFTAWSETHVYFPAQHSGEEWIDSVPRHPVAVATKHVGL